MTSAAGSRRSPECAGAAQVADFLEFSFRIFAVVALSRAISCLASPRLLTVSMLRNDSVVDPFFSAVVSAKMIL